MSGWLETGGVLLLAAAGVLLGRWFSRLPGPYWGLGYLVPLALVLLIGLARRVNVVEMVPPVSWMMAGRREFALSALLTTLLLTTPLSRLPSKRTRLMVWAFMAAVVGHAAVLPFLAPALNRNYLARLETKFDQDGICRQSNDYTCGPAAAVTALRQLGFPAEEGQIAILAHTSRFTGTEPDFLRDALNKLYGAQGLVCEYRHFRSVQELTKEKVTLARIKFGLLVDHWVTVLEVDGNELVLGDPFAGKCRLTQAEFEKKWRFCGLVLRRGMGASPGTL